MTRISKSERIYLYCEKHKRITEHMVYLKESGKEITKCIECSHENPYSYPIYGRQQTKFEAPKPEKQTYGRIVA